MDRYILQVLKANRSAIEEINDTKELHAENIRKLAGLKEKVNLEMEDSLQKGKLEIDQELEVYKQKLQPFYDQEYEKRVQDLDDRFIDAKKEWVDRLLRGIVIHNG